MPEEKKAIGFDLKAWKSKFPKQAYFLVGALVLLIVVQVANSIRINFFTRQVRLQTEEINQASNQLKRLKGVSVSLKSPLDTLEKAKVDLEGKIVFLENYFYRKPLWANMLVEINAVLPEGVWLNKVDFKSSGIDIKASTMDTKAIVKLMNDLNKSIYFKNAKILSSIKDDKSDIVNFNLSLFFDMVKI